MADTRLGNLDILRVELDARRFIPTSEQAANHFTARTGEWRDDATRLAVGPRWDKQ